MDKIFKPKTLFPKLAGLKRKGVWLKEWRILTTYVEILYISILVPELIWMIIKLPFCNIFKYDIIIW